MSSLVELTSDLVSYQTTADKPDEIVRCLDAVGRHLDPLPLVVRNFQHNGVLSRVWSTTSTLTPDVFLSAHIDVVPAPPELFQVQVDGDKMFGRGVSDMKFAVACFINSLHTVYQSTRRLPSLALMLTSDEEVGGNNGTGYLVKEVGFRPKVVIVPDGGPDNKLVEEAKGVLHLKVSAQGVSAHASRPWEGNNALNTLITAVGRAQELYPTPARSCWRTTLNIGQIHGGSQTNQVPNLAEARLDVRHIPHDSHDGIIRRVQKAVAPCQVDLLVQADAFKISRDDPYIQRWVSLLNGSRDPFIREHGASDGRFFSALGVPVILSRPASGGIHSNDEFCHIQSLQDFNQRLTRYLLGF